MKKTFKYIGWGLLSVILLLLITIFTLQFKTYDYPATSIKADTSQAVINRGKYLAENVAHCGACHGDMSKMEHLNSVSELPLSGGFLFDLPIGQIYAVNITSDVTTGIGALTDEQLVGALRYGISHKGKTLLPLMPYQNMSDEDLTALISYLRTLPPVTNTVPEKSYNLLGKTINAFVLRPKGPDGQNPTQLTPDTGITYGAYLANNVANCTGCHTPFDPATGKPTGEPYSGGNKFNSVRKNNVVCVSPNITPHEQYGRITNWTKEQFIQRFRNGRLIPDSEMPWNFYRNMSDNDLTAIYNYLKSLPASANNPGPSVIQVTQ